MRPLKPLQPQSQRLLQSAMPSATATALTAGPAGRGARLQARDVRCFFQAYSCGALEKGPLVAPAQCNAGNVRRKGSNLRFLCQTDDWQVGPNSGAQRTGRGAATSDPRFTAHRTPLPFIHHGFGVFKFFGRPHHSFSLHHRRAGGSRGLGSGWCQEMYTLHLRYRTFNFLLARPPRATA